MSLPTPTELVTPPTPDPIRPITSTQATPPVGQPLFDETGRVSNFRINPETGELYDATGLDQVHAYERPGAGAPSDDAGTPTLSKNFSEVNFAYNNLIQPQPNILDNYASYTYNLSLFMLTPQQVADLYSFGKADTATWNLLMASGGAGDAKRDQAPNGAPVGRNKYFSNDFYLDNVVIKTSLTGQGTGMTVSAQDMSFSIFEPNGITLIPLLSQAFTDMMKNANIPMGEGKPNLVTTDYCMLITFYGYDDNGKLTKVGNNGTAPVKEINNDPQAIVEKYIVFKISELKFKVTTRGYTEYTARCALGTAPAERVSRGIVKGPGELIGETLGDLLSGPIERNNNSNTGERVDTPVVQSSYQNAPDPSTIRESQAGYSNLY